MVRQLKYPSRTRNAPQYGSGLYWQAIKSDVHRMAQQIAKATLYQSIKAGQLRVVHPNGDSAVFMPRMDVMHDAHARRTVAIFELPGVRSNELTLSVHEGVMYLRGRRLPRHAHEYVVSLTEQGSCKVPPRDGERSSEVPDDPNRYGVQELRYGTFQRDVKLPDGIKEQDIAASLKDGLLIVTWPVTDANPRDDTMQAKTEPVCSTI